MSHMLIHAESGERFSKPEEYAGYALLDASGRKMGRIGEVFVNGSGEPEYARVKTGLLRSKTMIMPVSSIAVDDQRRALTLK